MKRVTLATLLACVMLSATLAGCAGGLSQAPGTPPIPGLMVAESDAGRTIEAERGRKVTLRLATNQR